jgi:hypothetical protein
MSRPQGRTFRTLGAPSPSAQPHRWPSYMVSAPHLAAGSDESRAWLPHGEWHARKAGDPRTACGLSAVTWRIFWTLDFARAGRRACPKCAHEVREAAFRD